MTSEAVIAILRAHEAALRRQGVTRAALFGSTARGEGGPNSDLDIMVEIDPLADVDLYGYVGITQYIAELFSVPVDVSDRAMLIEPVRKTAERDAMYAF
uniref:DNA polymerase beta domain protein region n=1 Tax=Caulobacter sp. (strain K31) TaxID=366602 RepID=B0SXY5_CAUSK